MEDKAKTMFKKNKKVISSEEDSDSDSDSDVKPALIGKRPVVA